MDYGESSEPWDENEVLDDGEGWEDIELEDETPGPVTIFIQFKSGHTKEWTITLPKESSLYSGPVTKGAIMEIVSNSYSFGESPFIIIPLDDGAHAFVDLASTDYMELR